MLQCLCITYVHLKMTYIKPYLDYLQYLPQHKFCERSYGLLLMGTDKEEVSACLTQMQSYLWCMHMCSCVCRYACIWRPEVGMRCLSLFFFAIFFKTASHLTWSSTIWLDYLFASKLQGSCLWCSSIEEHHLCTQSLCGYWSSKLRSLCLYNRYSIVSSPQP